ncbi:MAG TPA: peptidoglycan-binding domain-containing protein [Lacunisphaera sp.]|nr:peptidoglycan-binding domain-containing protein [Lacunisphaera sp.]
MGAITGIGPGGQFFVARDSYPDKNGKNHWYETKFRKYPNPADGWADLAHVVYRIGGRDKLVLPPASKGDTLGFSSGMFDTKYYLGYGKSRDERIAHHHLAVMNAIAAMARELGEPMPDGSEPPRVVRVLRIGANDATLEGSPVAALQRIVGVHDDGVFGETTRAAVEAWQEKHHLKPDGVWGPVAYDVVRTEVTGEDLDALFGYEPAA